MEARVPTAAALPLAAGDGEVFDELPLEQAALKPTSSARSNGKVGRIIKSVIFLDRHEKLVGRGAII